MKRIARKAGFTLVEMLTVIVVMGLLVAVVTGGLAFNLARAKAKTAQLQLSRIASSITLLRDDMGRLPTASEGLTALVSEPAGATGWTGPYEPSSALKDPWDEAIHYRVDGNQFEVKSLGADRKPGGQGVNRDLTAPEAL
jgi:general secretion pathway protein G